MYFPLHYIKLQTTKMNLVKIVGLTSFQKRTISVCLIFFKSNFVSALSLISSVYVLSDFFYVSLFFVAVHADVRNLIKRMTQVRTLNS